jgi:hypothetical protein
MVFGFVDGFIVALFNYFLRRISFGDSLQQGLPVLIHLQPLSQTHGFLTRDLLH